MAENHIESGSSSCCKNCLSVISGGHQCNCLVTDGHQSRETRRMVLGMLVLLAVDVIWVGSAELTDFIFHREGFDKPFFTTYFKTSCFMVYLVGFVFYKPWRDQCFLCYQLNIKQVQIYGPVVQNGRIENGNVDAVRENTSLLPSSPPVSSPSSQVNSHASSPLPPALLTDPEFEQITDDEASHHSDCLDDEQSAGSKHVRFNHVREVRKLSSHYSYHAHLARLSYEDAEKLRTTAARNAGKLPIHKVAKVALIFCVLWFFASFGYQEAIADTSPAAVNILSSSSGLFTLILASIFPSSAADKFTVSKLLAVLLSICGIVMVTLSDAKNKTGDVNFGAFWALASAFLYACYLVMLRKKVPDEQQMDITMFFGLVGLFNCLLLWPGFFILHYTQMERFTFPGDASVWGFLVLNAFIGTVLAEFLWLWGCYLTSALTATLALSLVMPLTMLVDIFVKNVRFSWMFYVGSIPLFTSFFAVSLLSHYADWDPIMIGIGKLYSLCVHDRERNVASQQNNQEETERLITGDDGSANDTGAAVTT